MYINWRKRSQAGYTEIVDEGERRWGIVLPIRTIENILNSPDLNRRPELNEDWQSILWLYRGPKPSLVDKVEVKVTTDGRHGVILWRMKNGVQ